MARDINKLKDRLHAVKGLDSASAYNAQDAEERKKKQAAQLKSDAQINAARQAGEQARLAAIEKDKKILRENQEANVQAQKQATAKSNANRAVSPGIEDTISRKQQLTDAMVQLRDWGSGKGDKWQSNNDFQTAYNAYENAMSWAEQSEAAGDIDTAKYMREAASYLAKWGNIAGTELTKLTDQYGSFENAVAYRNGDRSGYREYLNRDKSWEEIDSHIKGLEKTIESTSDLKRRSEYMEELDWYNNYAQNNYTEAAENELDLLERKLDTLQNALAQSEINNSPLNGTPVDDSQKSETLKRFDEDIEAAKAANMDPWYISALEKARESFAADASPVSYEQNWQDIDRYDELSGLIGGLNDQITSAEQSLERAKTAEWERNNRIKYAALEQEMNAANWYFDNYDYENFKQLVASEQNSAAMMGMPDIYTIDVRNQYTKEEASIYMYLREKGRVEEADAFANYMQSTAAGRRNQQIGQRLADENIGIIGRTIGAVAANPGKIANTIDINLQKLGNVLDDEYIPIDYETTGNFGVASNVNREIATQELAALGTLNDALGVEIPYIGSYTLGDLYGTGVDYLNSAMNVALFGTGAAGTALAAEKFSDEYRAAKERGGTDNQAFNYAWGSSIAEGVGEQIVLDRYLGFLTKLGRNPGKAAAIWAGIISVAEGGAQEAATTVMENAVDKWTMGENSEFNIAVRRYEAMGYEHGTAEQMAIDDMNREILKSGIMGMLGQGAPVAGGYAAQGISNAAGSVQTAIDDAARGRQIQKMGNAQQMAQLMGEVTGETVTPEKSKRKLGKQQREFIENAGEYVSGADEATRDIVRGKVYDVANASAQTLDGTSQAAKEKADKRSAAMKTSETGASVGGESVTVQGFVKTAEKGSDAKLNIKKADGTLAEANMEDVTFDSKTSEVYSYAADMATPELANDFRMRIQPDQMGSIERVANGYSQAYDMARAGFKEASVRASSLTGALTDEQVSAAYKLGAEARKSAQIAAITKAAERAKANMGNAWKGGKASFDDSVVVDALDDTQKAQIDVASVFTGSMGMNVEFFESKADETGRFTRENGSYNRKTNTIYIDVNAGRYYKGDSPSKTALIRTLSHEVTHAIQRNSPEIYAELRDTVTDILDDAKGVTIEDLIDRKMAADSSLTTRDAAMDELVADACERMIEDSDAAQRLAEAHPEAAKTIFQKVGELLTKLKEAIKAAFKGRQLSTEAQLVMKDVERYQQMVDLWTKGVMETAEVSGRESFEVTDNGAVVSPEVAEVMESDDYTAPDKEWYSVRETNAWAEAHRKEYPNDADFEHNLALMQAFDRNVAADSVTRYLVPHGRIPKTAKGPLRNNVEYVYTFGMDTKCERTYQFLAYRDAVQKKIGRQLYEDEARCLIELMRAYGQMIPCTYCYVEGKRMKLAELYMKYLAKNGESVMGTKYSAEQVFDIVEAARTIVSGYLDDRFNVPENYTLDRTLANGSFEGYRDFNMPVSQEEAAQEIYDRYNITDKAAKRVIAGYVAEWVYSRSMDVPMNLVNTDADFRSDSIDEKVLAFHDLAGKAAQGGAKAKGIENYEPYVDQLKNISVEDKRYMVGMGGIRKHSSNDFQIQNVQDYMLFFMDLAADKRGGVEWTGHTYTKNLDYARIFAPTNDRINVSIAMYGDNKSGIRANTQEGVVWEELQKVRKQYKNVGAMAMVTNNDQLSFALNSDWIDMIIPFHASGMKRSLYYDVLAWTDYTSKQSERLYTKGQMIDRLRQKGIKVSSSAKAADVQRMFMENFDVKTVYNEKTGKRVAPHFFPGETEQHGVTIPGHGNDAQRYFELCEQYGTNPRFFGVKVQDANGNTIDVTEHPAYLKLIKETARTDTPQQPIVAKFDMDYVNKAMKDFKGYANLAEDSYGIVDEFVKEYVGKKRKVGYLTERAQQYREIRTEMAAEEAEKRAQQRTEMLENINNADAADVDSASMYDDVQHSARVTDPNTLDFLDNQETVTTYKTMQVVNGKLYPPMAAVVAGSYEDASELGTWEQATEHPELIKLDKKGKPQFVLNKGQGKGNVPAAYNPYMHSSNLVLNDQFSSAYNRPNLVTVECEVPVSELTSGYRAQYAKDAVGWHSWHTGTVAGALRKATGMERQVLLSRWIKPVRIVPDAEVARMYKDLLDGTGVAVPDNVVPPGLLTELEKIGVPITESGKVSRDDVQFMARDGRLTEKTTEEERYELLKDAVLTVTKAKTDKVPAGSLVGMRKTESVKAIKNIARLLGIEELNLHNSSLDMDFGFSLKNVGKSASHQSEYGGNSDDFVKALSCIEELAYNAIPIEMHTDKKVNTAKANPDLKMVYVFVSAYSEEGAVVPVQMEVKEFNNRQTGLYLNVALKKIESGVWDTGRLSERQKVLPYLVPNSKIRIADIFRNVNPETDARFLKYVPDGFLNDIQKAAKENALAAQNREYESYQYQTRDPHAISDREILANALESAAQTDDERIRLAAYKEGLAKLNSYQAVLDENKAVIGQLAFKKGRTSEENDRLTRAKNRVKMINEKLDEADRALQKLEDMDPIKAIIQREGAKVRAKSKAVMKERLADVRQTHENAATRKSIGRKVKRLNDMLINATDQRHIPEEFKYAVKDMLELFTNDTSVFDKDRLERVRTAYAAIEASKTDAASMYDDDIAYEIELLATTIGGRRLAKLNANELQMVRNILDHFAKMVKDANNVFLDGRRASIDALSFEVEEQTSGKQHMENRLTEAKFRKWLTEGQIIPPYFFKNLGGAMGRLGDAILAGEDNYGIEVRAAKARLQELMRKFNHREWANRKNDTLELVTESGDAITLTREQALGLYATHKREVSNKDQNAHHLSEAGIVFRKQVKDLKLFKKTFRNSNAVPISGKDMEAVMDWLTKEQMQYADAMVEYISTEMAVLGNETSMQLHGYRKFSEGFYYPYKVASDFLKSDFSKTEDALIKNMGFTKRTQRGASNPLVVTDFTKTVADHVNRMLLYHNFAVPQDSFMRVYDHHISKSKTVKSALDTAYGNRIGSYINQFMKDMYGGVVRDNTEDIANQWLGKFKKAKVMASLSVAVQQPSSIGRAFALVNVKYFRPVHAKGAFDEAMQYAGTAVIKSIGRFDTNTGSNVVDWMTREGFDGVMDFVDTAGGFLPEQMDMISWGTIWDAVKREQADKTGLDIDSEELKKIAGKRFNEVIRFTQVYDSTLVRSQTMRSKSVWAKMATSFMSEATVTYNMVYDALQNITKEPRKAAATFAAVAGSIIANALLKSIVTAARDDDDEEATYKELYIKNFMADLINGFAPMTYVPLASDIWSIAQGFTVERTDLEVFNLAKEFVDIMQNENAGTEKKLRTAVSFISMVSGIPISNVWREVDAIKNTITAVQNTERPAWFETAIKRGLSDGVILSYFFDDSKAANVDKLYKEARTGSKDAAETREHLILYNNVKDDKAVDSLLRTRIKDGFTAGEIGADEAIELLTGYAGMKQDDASDKVLEWQYAIDNDGSSYSDMRERYLEGEISYDDAVSDRVQYGGIEEDKAKATVDKWEFERLNGYAYEDLREEHADGNVSSAEAMEIMQDYGGKDENEAYWEVTEWDYGDGWDGKGTLLNDAFAAGSDAQVRSRMQELAGHSDWQKPGNELASYVTDYYKAIYEAAPAAQKDALRQTILGYLKMAYEVVGEEYYGDDYALRYRSWLRSK